MLRLACVAAIGVSACALAAEPTAAPNESKLLPYKDRLAAAKSVRVMTSILGLELGTSLAQAHARLDKISEGGKATKEEAEAEEGAKGAHKTLWKFPATDYSALFAQSNDEGEITNINAFLREGKELPFEKIGEVKKAPLQSDTAIAWDVIRPNRPLFRIVAQGAGRKARSINIFVVKRPEQGHEIRLPEKTKHAE